MKINLKIALISCLFTLSLTVNAQLRVKTDGNVKIGTQSPSPSGGKLEITGINETLEVRLFSSSANISRFWAANSLYAFGFGIDASGYGQIYGDISSPVSFITFNSIGNFGIGRSPSYKLDVNGNIRVFSTIYTSDEKLKSNINLITSQTDKLFKLRSVSYNLKMQDLKSAHNTVETESTNSDKINNQIEEQDNRIHYGFIAQEVKNIYPELVYEDEDGILGIDYTSFIPLLVAEMKQQLITINYLKQEIEVLKADNRNAISNNSNKSYGELYQNYPNPFNQSTTIKFRLSDNVNIATICLYNMQGNQLKSYPIDNKIESIEIKASELRPGMYIYAMIVDNILIDTKTMIITQ